MSRRSRRRTAVGLVVCIALFSTFATVEIRRVNAFQAQKKAEEQNQVLRAEIQRLHDELQVQVSARESEEAKRKAIETASLQTIPEGYRQFVVDASKEFNVPVEIIAALGQQESGWDCNMLGKDEDTGCLQVLPSTGEWAMKEMKIDGDLWNPQTNIRVGAWVLAKFLEMEHGDIYAALSSYNAGPRWRDTAPNVASRYADSVLRRAFYSSRSKVK